MMRGISNMPITNLVIIVQFNTKDFVQYLYVTEIESFVVK